MQMPSIQSPLDFGWFTACSFILYMKQFKLRVPPQANCNVVSTSDDAAEHSSRRAAALCSSSSEPSMARASHACSQHRTACSEEMTAIGGLQNAHRENQEEMMKFLTDSETAC
eukprot:1498312-Amphidinium_carterae.2